MSDGKMSPFYAVVRPGWTRPTWVLGACAAATFAIVTLMTDKVDAKDDGAAAPVNNLHLEDPRGRPPAELLEDARRQGDAGRTAEAAVLAYLSLRSATQGTPLTREQRSQAHLLLSELTGQLGDYAAERVHGKQAINLFSGQTPPDAKTYGHLLKRQGDLAARINDFAVARLYYDDALAQLASAADETAARIEIHLALTRIALTQARLQHAIDATALEGLGKAQEHLDSAKALMEAGGTGDWGRLLHVQADLLLGLSGHLATAGHFDRASASVAEADRLLHMSLDQIRLNTQRRTEDELLILNGLVTAKRRAKQFVKAMDYVDEAMTLAEERQRTDPEIVFNMALTAAHFEDKTALETTCRIVATQEKSTFEKLSEGSSEAVAIAYSENGRVRSAVCLALLAQSAPNRDRSKLMVDIILKRKAIIAEAETRFWRTVHSTSNADLLEKRRYLLKLRESLSTKMTARDPTGLWQLTEMIEAMEAHLGVGVNYVALTQDPAMAQTVHSLSTYGQALIEGKLGWDAVKTMGQYLQEPDVNAAAIMKDLPPGSVLIEFSRIDSFDLDREVFTGAATYWAFILLPQGYVDAVPIGNAEAIDALIFEALDNFGTGDRVLPDRQLKAMKRLYGAIWQPLADTMAGNAEKVILSPDGALALVPFTALLDPKTDRFLIEDKTLYLVGSGRLRPASVAKDQGPPVIVGDPAFGDKAPRDDLAIFPQELVPLAGTRTEAQTVADMFGSNAILLMDDRASETRLRMTRRPRVLHIASHGVFLADQAPVLSEDLVVYDRVAAQAAYARHVRTLSRSGIALAGANTGGLGNGDDGFLTSFDVAALDLSGTDLVVLSGCETGLGSLQDGEGVLGLRRSFRIAGADYVVMSLWRLPDREAVRQMRAFYRSYLKNGDPVIALRDVLRRRIHWYKEALGELPPPAIWAALTIAGGPS